MESEKQMYLLRRQVLQLKKLQLNLRYISGRKCAKDPIAVKAGNKHRSSSYIINRRKCDRFLRFAQEKKNFQDLTRKVDRILMLLDEN